MNSYDEGSVNWVLCSSRPGGDKARPEAVNDLLTV
jgi:hypothetical protein